MKNVVIISSSPRKNGNSDILCQQFMRGAKETGNIVNYVRLAEKNINYCKACGSCEISGECFQNDDMKELIDLCLKADVIVLATPVYFYSMSGQLKVFIDRLLPKYTSISADIYIFATAWDSETKNLNSTLEAIRGLTRDCFENCTEKGYLLVGDVYHKGDINDKDEQLFQAYRMGRNC